MKRVLLVILFLLIIGAGAGGTIYFYMQNKNQIEQNEMLAQQNSAVQAQLDAIGALVECYEVSRSVKSGMEILDGDLIPVTVPASTLSTASVTDKTLLVGRHYRVDVDPGTILSLDMLMDEDAEAKKFPYDLTLQSLPVSTAVGDFIDIRILLANGEEYVVLNHKEITRITNTTTVTFDVTEEENYLLISMFHDLATYSSGCICYAVKYLEPGNSNSVAFYPVQAEMTNFVRYNRNIEDTTRCINENLRAHIDEVLLLFTNSNNITQASSFIAKMTEQLSGQVAAQNQWIADKANNQDETGSGEYTDEGGESFEDQVGDAMDDLAGDAEDLEAIQ